MEAQVAVLQQSRTIASVARVAWAIAEKDAAKLDQIETELIAGNDQAALELMRNYFLIKKQPALMRHSKITTTKQSKKQSS